MKGIVAEEGKVTGATPRGDPLAHRDLKPQRTPRGQSIQMGGVGRLQRGLAVFRVG